MRRNAEYQPQTAAATLRRIVGGANPWLSLGQFLIFGGDRILERV